MLPQLSLSKMLEETGLNDQNNLRLLHNDFYRAMSFDKEVILLPGIVASRNTLVDSTDGSVFKNIPCLSIALSNLAEVTPELQQETFELMSSLATEYLDLHGGGDCYKGVTSHTSKDSYSFTFENWKEITPEQLGALIISLLVYTSVTLFRMGFTDQPKSPKLHEHYFSKLPGDLDDIIRNSIKNRGIVFEINNFPGIVGVVQKGYNEDYCLSINWLHDLDFKPGQEQEVQGYVAPIFSEYMYLFNNYLDEDKGRIKIIPPTIAISNSSISLQVNLNNGRDHLLELSKMAIVAIAVAKYPEPNSITAVSNEPKEPSLEDSFYTPTTQMRS